MKVRTLLLILTLALCLGMRIGVALLDRPAMPGIDTPEDLAAAERHWIAQAMGNT